MTRLVAKAERHLKQCECKTAVVYTRSAFEKHIRKHCEKKKLSVLFDSRLKDYSTEIVWKVIKDDMPGQTRNDIETCRPQILNAFSHYNTEKHVMAITVPAGECHIAATWKEDNVRIKNYDPDTNRSYSREYYKGDLLQGKVTIKNSNPLMPIQTSQ